MAFRDKDRDFVRVLLRENLIKPKKLFLRLTQLAKHSRVTPKLLEATEGWIRGVLKDIGPRE